MKATHGLIELLNDALAREMRSQAMYAHYAAYVKGIHRLHLKPYFETEAAESVTHAQIVRNTLVRLGGIAVTKRHTQVIEHTTDYRVPGNQSPLGLKRNRCDGRFVDDVEDTSLS